MSSHMKPHPQELLVEPTQLITFLSPAYSSRRKFLVTLTFSHSTHASSGHYDLIYERHSPSPTPSQHVPTRIGDEVTGGNYAEILYVMNTTNTPSETLEPDQLGLEHLGLNQDDPILEHLSMALLPGAGLTDLPQHAHSPSK